MPKCPSCGKKIDSLINKAVEVNEYTVTLDERGGTGRGDFGLFYDFSADTKNVRGVYLCPECKHPIATSHEKAKQFLGE